MTLKSHNLGLVFLASVLLTGCASTASRLPAVDEGSAAVDIYFTRHAEKKTQMKASENGGMLEVCGKKKCAEELNAAGLLRANLLAKWFRLEGITGDLTHIYSSHKLRTLQTIELIAKESGLNGDKDKNPNDGVQEFPVMNKDGKFATELNPESTSGSIEPTVEALKALPAGSVALVAGHSGTLYKIMYGLGLDDACAPDNAEGCDEERYPINAKGKVANFGDIWHIRLTPETASFDYRVNLQLRQLDATELVN